MNKVQEFFDVFRGEHGRMNFFLLIVWASYPLSLLLSFFFSRIPILKDIKEFAFPIFLIICLFFAFKGFIKKDILKVFIFYIITFFIIAFCDIYAPPANTIYIKEYLPAFFFTTLPFVFIGNEYRDERIYKVLFLASVFSIFVFFAYHFILNPLSEVLFDEEEQESQGLAYTFLPYLVVVVWRLFEKFDFFKLAISLFSAVILLLLGSRGSILSLMSFIFLYLIIRKQIYKKIGWLFLGVLIGVLIIVYLEQILLFFLEFAGNLGYSTRIFEMLAEGEVSSDNGRNFIVDRIWDALNNRPWGLGLCGSHVVASGFYAHNLFLEILASFGYYFGGLICALLLFLIVKGFFSCSDDTQRGFYLVLFCVSFVPLMVSGIFLKEPLLFMFIGYNFYLIGRKKKNDRSIVASY